MAPTELPPHPARFSDPILAVIGPMMAGEASRVGHPVRVLDPFAGIGGVHKLATDGAHCQPSFRPGTPDIHTVGIELEPEWAMQHPHTIVGDAMALPFADASFDVVVTSPTYGNRMADHHNAKDGSKRLTYRHTLGRALTPGNSGAMQWGNGYRALHRWSWEEVGRVLAPDGLFILNVSNHIRNGAEVPVVEWHEDTIMEMGFTMEWDIEVPTARLRYGQNHASRVDTEHVIGFRRA